MIRDLRTDPADSPVEADVCIVGAGAAGLTLALELNAKARVVVLESGGLCPDNDRALLSEGEVVGLPFEGLEHGRVQAFGGTTNVWDGQCIEIDDIAFDRRDWVPHSGWPFTKRHLATSYARARHLLNAPDPRGDRRLQQRFERQRPSFDTARIDCRLSVINRRLQVGELYRDRLAGSDRVQVLLHAHACEIRTNDSASAVTSVDIRTLEGRTARVSTNTVVLCGGGIENARLLLLSNRVEAAGLGNRRDLVGRFFQEHPTLDLGALLPHQSGVVHAHFGVLRHRSLLFLPRIHLSDDVQRQEQVLGCVADIVYEDDPQSGHAAAREIVRSIRARRWPPDAAVKIGRIVREAPSLAAEGYRRLARGVLAAPRSSTPRLQLHLEQAPNRLSRVSLSFERDALGLNRARVDWRLTDLDRRTADTMARTAAAEFERIGATLAPGDWMRSGAISGNGSIREAYHHMGTTRMADDPANGVVDANCQVHGVAGLYVCGSSVFPAAGSANPTLTIVALAVRLAAHLGRVLHA